MTPQLVTKIIGKASSPGELLINLASQCDPAAAELQRLLRYDYSAQHPRSAPDPYEAVLSKSAQISSARQFFDEYRRVFQIIHEALSQCWSIEMFYFPAGHSSAEYHVEFDSERQKSGWRSKRHAAV